MLKNVNVFIKQMLNNHSYYKKNVNIMLCLLHVSKVDNVSVLQKSIPTMKIIRYRAEVI